MKALKRFKKEFEFADMFGYDVSKYKTGYNHHAYFLGLDMYPTEETREWLLNGWFQV